MNNIMHRIFEAFTSRTRSQESDKSPSNLIKVGFKWNGTSDHQITNESIPKSETWKPSNNFRHLIEITDTIPSYKRSFIHNEKISFGIRESPLLWKEKVVSTKDKFNKVFCSGWIDDKRVVFGTKDNKLMLLYCDGNNINLNEIKLPKLKKRNNVNRKDINNCGMHDIAVNPNKNWIATGGYKTNDICLYSYDNQYDNTNIKPIRLLSGHDDWLFGLDWFDDETLISGGRDGKLNIWKPDTIKSKPSYTYDSSVTNVYGTNGIRALKSHPYNNNIVILKVNGEVEIFDVKKTKTVWKQSLKYSKEAVCININTDRGQIIVGSQAHISMIDPRNNQETCNYINSVDQGWGVRTISVHNDLITIGGGLGRLSFYDARTSKYNIFTRKENKNNKYLSISKGWLRKDDIYENVFIEHSLPTPTAIYSHCYSPNLSKLFVGGGPTPFGLFGSFVSVLS